MKTTSELWLEQTTQPSAQATVGSTVGAARMRASSTGNGALMKPSELGRHSKFTKSQLLMAATRVAAGHQASRGFDPAFV